MFNVDDWYNPKYFGSKIQNILFDFDCYQRNAKKRDSQFKRAIEDIIDILGVEGVYIYQSEQNIEMRYKRTNSNLVDSVFDECHYECGSVGNSKQEFISLQIKLVEHCPDMALIIFRSIPTANHSSDFFVWLVRSGQDEINKLRHLVRLEPLSISILSHRILQAARSHCRSLQFCAPEIVRNLVSDSTGLYRSLISPWEREEGFECVTVAIDIRKSSKLMKGIKLSELTDLMQQLAERSRDITFRHNGVFDKFTGDGVLLHFLGSDYEKLGSGDMSVALRSLRAVIALLSESRDVIAQMTGRTVTFHKNIGIVAGVDIGESKWSIDANGGPFVVGQPVVNACRLSNGKGTGTIWMTNRYKERVSMEKVIFEELVKPVKMSSKELKGKFYRIHFDKARGALNEPNK